MSPLLPGREVVNVDAGTSQAILSNTGVGFIVAEAQRGPITPTLITSPSQLVAVYGPRQTFSYLHDAVEAAFNNGVSAVWVSRVIGPAATAATLALSDGTGTTFTVRAASRPVAGQPQQQSYGAWANGPTGLAVIVLTNTDDATIPAGSFKLRITENGVIVEDSPVLADKNEALLWSQNSAQTVELISGVQSGDPSRIVSPGSNLAGGADDRGSIVELQWTTALDRFTSDLGAGQVAAPGRTTGAWHLAVLEHARTHGPNRHALLDNSDTPTVATIIAEAAAAAAAPNSGARHGSMYWPWAKIGGLLGVAGTRTVPWSAVQMGLFAKVDAGSSPFRPAAGERRGLTKNVVGLSQDTSALTDAQATSLNDAGVNIARIFYGIDGPVEYGNRTLRNAVTDPLWAQAHSSRIGMFIAAQGDAVIRRFVHEIVDGQFTTQRQLESELTAFLADLWEKRALYGATPQEAFSATADSTVNPPVQLATGLLKAVIEYRPTPSADRVRLELSRTAITEAI
jgi:hypothetical protein